MNSIYHCLCACALLTALFLLLSCAPATAPVTSAPGNTNPSATSSPDKEQRDELVPAVQPTVRPTKTPSADEAAIDARDQSEQSSAQEPGVVGETVGDVGAAFRAVSTDVAKNLAPQRVRDQLDRSLWKDEVLAQDHEMTFVDLWDAVRESSDKLSKMADFEFDQITVHAAGEAKMLSWGIELLKTDGPASTYTQPQFKAWLAELASNGYELVELEFHHSKFDRAKEGQPAKSVMNSVFHVVNRHRNERIVIRGELDIVWSDKLNSNNHPIVSSMDVSRFTVLRRQGDPFFREVGKRDFYIDNSGSKAPPTTHPIMMYDLNRDGLDELIVGGFNEVHWNQGGGSFKPSVMCDNAPHWVNSGIIADFTGDGFDDLLLGLKENLPALYRGDAEGRFTEAPIPITACNEKLRTPTTITAGDVDGDGDLDVWLGQYRPPYLDGHMPTPYYDANDGFPSYLLINDGRGDFVDATETAGLAPKRFRRMYSSSLVDLNNDNLLDLICVSDFAGIDLYYNLGKGKFKDVTSEVLAQQDSFGMSHSFGDYNRDGLLDFFVIGMSSTTARRLDYLRLGRDDFADRTSARSEMGYGNRMMLAGEGGLFTQAPFNDQVARSGWSWGSGTFDADNDGDLDLYVCNGHMSGRSCKDYCTRYWTQDIYNGDSQSNKDLKAVFALSLKDLNDLEISWNGFEHKVLWMQDQENNYYNIAFLMGVAFEFDARSLIVNDFDADGKVDLVVEEFNRRENRHTLHLLKNEWENGANHWIGVNLVGAPGVSPLGAKLVCKTADREYIAQNVSGHSVWAQHPNRVHWGIGDANAVTSITVRWPNGKETTLDNPSLDKYHSIAAPTQN